MIFPEPKFSSKATGLWQKIPGFFVIFWNHTWHMWQIMANTINPWGHNVTPWTVVCQASLSMGFFQARILEWVAISFSKGDLPHPGTEPILPASLALAGSFFITAPPGKHHYRPYLGINEWVI